MDSYRPISDYVLGKITGVAEGYQQLLRRVDTLRGGFEGIMAIIRTRLDLILEAHNLSLLCRKRSSYFGMEADCSECTCRTMHVCRQFLGGTRVVTSQIEVHKPVSQPLTRLVNIPVPQEVLDSFQLPRHLGAGFWVRVREPLRLLPQHRYSHRDVKPVDHMVAGGMQILPDRRETPPVVWDRRSGQIRSIWAAVPSPLLGIECHYTAARDHLGAAAGWPLLR